MASALTVDRFLGPAAVSAAGPACWRDWWQRLSGAYASSREGPPGGAVGAPEAEAADVAAARRGDGDAYRRLVRQHQGAIAEQMRRFSRDPGVLEELVQDVFVEAYRGLGGYRGSGAWLHWLRKIAVRVGYRYWKRNRGRPEVTLRDEDWQRLRGELPAPDEAADAAELVHGLLALLGPSDRLILTLLHLEGCSMAEAAARAGWSHVGAKVRAFRARLRLKKLIERGPS